jgi:hypothetical protein
LERLIFKTQSNLDTATTFAGSADLVMIKEEFNGLQDVARRYQRPSLQDFGGDMGGFRRDEDDPGRDEGGLGWNAFAPAM